MAIQGFFTGDVKIRDLNGVLKAVNGIVEVATDAGTVTSVGLTVGSTGTDVNVANSPITTSGSITLNLPTASATNRGLLSSADWAIFSAKQGTITLTTTGNNGSATLISGTLNIPTYTLAGLGGISLTSLSASSPLLYNNTTGAFSIQVANGSQNGYLSSSDWTAFNSKQAALTFSSPLVNTSGTISIPAATSSVNGYLTSTDWSTFNNKQNTLILTTTGSSGASTLVGATLNIPTYTLSGLGGVPTSRQLTINGTAYDLSADRSWSVGTVTSVSASITGNSVSISGSPIINSGTLAFSFLGNATQYVRGDGALATLPTNGGGGGASVSYYLNGSINQGTIGGVTYYEMNKTPIIGAGTDFSRNTDGYIASFLTDANDPALLNIPAGNFNFETYFEASSGGGSPTFYIELYKYDGTNFTLIASNSTSPKLINDATNIEAYFSALAVPQTTLTLTDRLAIRIYVTTAGRTITMHTENGHLCQVITTFTTGLTALNGLTAQVQYLATGTSGTDFNISSATATHTFNLPTASATNRGALASADWSMFNAKQNAITLTTTGSSGSSTLVGATLNVPTYTLSGLGGVPTSRQLTINGTAYDLSADRSWSVGTVTSIATSGPLTGGTITGSGTIGITQATTSTDGYLSSTDWNTFNSKQNALTNPVTGTGTTNYLSKFTGTSTIGNSLVYDNGTNVIIGNGSTDIQGRLQVTTSSGALLLNTDNSNFAILFRNTASSNKLWDISTFNNNLVFNEGGVGTRLFMQAGGNIGIGTITPSFLLDVNGTLRASANVTGTDNVAVFHNTNTTTSGTPVIALSTASTGPDAPADIRLAGTNTKGIRIYAADSTLTSTPLGAGFQMFSVSSTNFPGQMFFDSGANNSAFISFRTAVTSGTIAERMRITANGNISIGNTNDTFKLDVSGTLRATGAATFSSSVMVNGSTVSNEGLSVQYNQAKTYTPQTSVSRWHSNEASGSQFKLNLFAIGNATSSSRIFKFQTSNEGVANDGIIAFQTDGGNVGIGTTSPDQRLVIANTSGTVYTRWQSDFGDGYIGMETADDSMRILTAQSTPIQFYTNNVERMRITSGGGIKISAGSPPTSGDGLEMWYNGTNSVIGSIERSTGTNKQLYFFGSNTIFENGGSERMRITSGGNVGIGTTSPESVLSVQKNVAGGRGGEISIVNYAASTVGNEAALNFGIENSTYGSNDGNFQIKAYLNNTNGATDAIFSNWSGSAFLERMRITSGGQLQIKQAGNTYYDGLALLNTASNIFSLVLGGNNNIFLGFNYGDVGYFNYSTGAYTAISDINKKKDFEDSTIGLNAILGLKPTLFRMKDEEGTGKHLGFIAQEVKDYIPQAYSESSNGDNTFIGLTEMPIIAANTKAIQELYAIIQKQQIEIDTLKNK